jgi:hypothetical protein
MCNIFWKHGRFQTLRKMFYIFWKHGRFQTLRKFSTFSGNTEGSRHLEKF